MALLVSRFVLSGLVGRDYALLAHRVGIRWAKQGPRLGVGSAVPSYPPKTRRLVLVRETGGERDKPC
jgi:hypothetical protein